MNFRTNLLSTVLNLFLLLFSDSYFCLQLIRFFMSSNLTLRELYIENSPQFHIKFDGCEGVHIEDISINSPSLSPNTDGIHIQDTKYVGIYNSVISSGTFYYFFAVHQFILWLGSSAVDC